MDTLKKVVNFTNNKVGVEEKIEMEKEEEIEKCITKDTDIEPTSIILTLLL